MNRRALLSACALALFACAGPVPDSLGLHDGRLADCPASPNCVSSDAADSEHAIAPLEFSDEPEDAWRALRVAIEALPRTTIVYEGNGYLHAESRSTLFRFVDDLELRMRPDERSIAIRSASRIGHSDLGVNRNRAEELRSLFESHLP